MYLNWSRSPDQMTVVPTAGVGNASTFGFFKSWQPRVSGSAKCFSVCIIESFARAPGSARPPMIAAVGREPVPLPSVRHAAHLTHHRIFSRGRACPAAVRPATSSIVLACCILFATIGNPPVAGSSVVGCSRGLCASPVIAGARSFDTHATGMRTAVDVIESNAIRSAFADLLAFVDCCYTPTFSVIADI